MASSRLFFVDGAVDPDTLPAAPTDEPSATVMLVDVDPASSHRGERTPVRARFLPSIGCITAAARPGAVLPPGVRHAFVVTRRVEDAKGVALGPSAELARIAGLDAADRTGPAELLYGEALDALVESGAVDAPGDVAGLAVFTTSRAWEELYVLRDRLRSAEIPPPQAVWDPPSAAPYEIAVFSAETSPSLDDWLGAAPRDADGLEWPGGDDPAGVAHEAIGAVASFAMPAPRFLDPETDHFEPGAEGDIQIADPSALIPVTLVLPKAPPPPSGYPVVVHGHGLSNDRGSMLSNANELARAGFAVVGIDDVLHGTRAGLPDVSNRFPGSYDGPDGIPDPLPFPVAFFGAFLDFVATRDHFRQTVLDQMSLVRLVQNGELDLAPVTAALGGVTPRLDGSRIAWSGGSLGGIMGSMTVAVEPEFDAAALQVPGGGFIPFVVAASAELFGLVEAVTLSTYVPVGDEPLDEMHPVGLLISHITEPGDPLAYAGGVLGDRPAGADTRRPHVLLTYTADDEVLPNLATHALIRAMGLPLVGDVLIEPDAVNRIAGPASRTVGDRTAGAVQYAPSTHALGYNRRDVRKFEPGHPREGASDRFPALPAPITVELPIREHSMQLTGFLSAAVDGIPEIRITAPTRADLDADGVDDDAEIAAGTDPWDPASR